jgi:hypothetical protein
MDRPAVAISRPRLIVLGHGEGTGAGGKGLVLELDFDGLELVFEQDEADTTEALAFPLVGGEAVDDLFIGMVAGAGALGGVGTVDFGAEGLFLFVGEKRFHRVLLRKFGIKSERPNWLAGAFESDRRTLISP